ncbi:MAG: prepilin peptidase [bacterium]
MELISSYGLITQIYILVLTGIIGLVFGSFLNVVALRLISGESIVFPASKCPKCQNTLVWYDNIPVLSYIMLSGKCRNCRDSISIQYPLVEAATSILFILLVNSYGVTLKTLCLLALTCCLIIITITDCREKVIFDITSIPLIPLGLIYNFFDIGNTGSEIVQIPLKGIGITISLNEIFISAIIGAIIGGIFFEILSRIGFMMVGQYAFGTGDSIITAALGAWFGWKMLIIILALSFVFQFFIGVPVILLNMRKDKDYKSITFMGVLMFSLFIPYIGRFLGLTNTFLGSLIVLLVTFAFAGAGIYVILERTKERQSFTFIAFGPALVLGGFLIMFYGQKLLNKYILTFLS